MTANVVSNVVRFPIEKRKEQISLQNSEDLDYIEDYVDELTGDVVGFFIETGYPVDQEDYIQDISLLFESIRSITYKANDLYHPVQDIATTMFSEALRILDTQQLCLDFGEEENYNDIND
jgi:hypothetical protein